MNRSRGFTLIELMIVLTIIGILAAIAIPRFADTKNKAYIAEMKSELKNLVPAAEAWHLENNTYAGFMAPLGLSGVSISVTAANATGWSATATHVNVGNSSCKVGVGSATPIGLAEGEPGGPNCK